LEKEPEDIFEFVEKTPSEKPEVKVEKIREALEKHGENFETQSQPTVESEELPGQAPPTDQPTMPLPITAEEERFREVERVLAEGLHDLFLNLPAAEQQKFKNEGEKAAREVNGLLGQVKVKIDQLIWVIRRWLASVPGINKFFVEQEAKIKAQKLLLLKERK